MSACKDLSGRIETRSSHRFKIDCTLIQDQCVRAFCYDRQQIVVPIVSQIGLLSPILQVEVI